MPSLQRARLAPEAPLSQFVSDAELPLPRLYRNELDRSSDRQFRQLLYRIVSAFKGAYAAHFQEWEGGRKKLLRVETK